RLHDGAQRLEQLIVLLGVEHCEPRGELGPFGIALHAATSLSAGVVWYSSMSAMWATRSFSSLSSSSGSTPASTARACTSETLRRLLVQPSSSNSWRSAP